VLGDQKTSTFGEKPCISNGYRAYASPELAVLMVDSRDNLTRLFEAEGSGAYLTGSLESRYQNMTLLKEIPLPEFTRNQRRWFAIKCALAVCDDPVFVSWAENWINGIDRSKETAMIAYEKLRIVRQPSEMLIIDSAFTANTNFAAYLVKENQGMDFSDLAKQALSWQE
jgi:hypothetical protein